MAKKWIQKTHMKKGALHRQLHVPEGEKIPASKMKAAREGKYGALAERRAHFAHTLASFDVGGRVTETGDYHMEKGETVLPSPEVSNLPDWVQQLSPIEIDKKRMAEANMMASPERRELEQSTAYARRKAKGLV